MANTPKPKKVRALNTGPKSVPAQARRALYGNAITQVKNAIEHRYPLEAIALLESMIADRLEARLAWVFNQDPDKQKFSTLGKLTDELCGKKSTESDDAKAVYKDVQAWADRRNEALHQMVKLADDDAKDWNARNNEAQAAAKAGLTLFRKLDALVRKLNKPPKSATKALQPEN